MSESRNDPIDLAQAADFRLGALEVNPSTREVKRGDWREMLEPRVMQVLVALHQAAGAVVSRDALIARCWEGRVVGEDAINRAIGRLRRLSEADNGASFTVETIPRVGYRLRAAGITPAAPALPREPATTVRRHDRRLLLAGGATALLAMGAGFLLLRKPAPPSAMPPKLALLLEQAKQAFRGGNPESGAQAAGLYESATRMAPNSADAWGGTALAYSYGGRYRPDQMESIRIRAQDALRHARALDPHNAYAYASEASLLPIRGAWSQREAIYREGLKFNPRSDELQIEYADMLNNIGRNREAADLMAQASAAASQPDPALTWLGTTIYWCAGRLAEADAIAQQGATLFPRQRSCWFTHVYLLMFTARSNEALAILDNEDARPPGQPDTDFEAVALVAKALKTKSKADVDTAIAANTKLAHAGAGYAENFIAFAAAMGRLDEAFTVANGLYFGRGFEVGNLRFSAMQRAFTSTADRRTRTLFYPSSSPMWRDPRFATLVEELGLTKYWQDSGAAPDYRRA